MADTPATTLAEVQRLARALSGGPTPSLAMSEARGDVSVWTTGSVVVEAKGSTTEAALSALARELRAQCAERYRLLSRVLSASASAPEPSPWTDVVMLARLVYRLGEDMQVSLRVEHDPGDGWWAAVLQGGVQPCGSIRTDGYRDTDAGPCPGETPDEAVESLCRQLGEYLTQERDRLRLVLEGKE